MDGQDADKDVRDVEACTPSLRLGATLKLRSSAARSPDGKPRKRLITNATHYWVTAYKGRRKDAKKCRAKLGGSGKTACEIALTRRRGDEAQGLEAAPQRKDRASLEPRHNVIERIVR